MGVKNTMRYKKKIIILLAFLLFATPCYGAELLVKMVDAWGTLESRSMKGDIIVVKPDGWKWGKEERPPRFVVIKLVGVKAEDVKHYERPLMDTKDPENPVMLKRRKHAIDIATVDSCSIELGGAKEIPKATFDANLITKTK